MAYSWTLTTFPLLWTSYDFSLNLRLIMDTQEIRNFNINSE